jgi:hypothetical protein
MSSDAILMEGYRQLAIHLERVTAMASSFVPSLVPSHAVSPLLAELAEEAIKDSVPQRVFDAVYESLAGELRSGASFHSSSNTREIASGIFAAQLKYLNFLVGWVSIVEKAGLSVPSAGMLREEVARVNRLRAAMLDHWQPFDRGDSAAAIAEHRAGETLTEEQLFSQALGVSTECLEEMTAKHLDRMKPRG